MPMHRAPSTARFIEPLDSNRACQIRSHPAPETEPAMLGTAVPALEAPTASSTRLQADRASKSTRRDDAQQDSSCRRALPQRANSAARSDQWAVAGMREIASLCTAAYDSSRNQHDVRNNAFQAAAAQTRKSFQPAGCLVGGLRRPTAASSPSGCRSRVRCKASGSEDRIRHRPVRGLRQRVSNEEGNADQRPPTGGEPHRHR